MTKHMTGTERLRQDRERHERRVKRLCVERGLQMIVTGTAWRITGPGIHVCTADLAMVTPEDLDARTKVARWD